MRVWPVRLFQQLDCLKGMYESLASETILAIHKFNTVSVGGTETFGGAHLITNRD